jgi:hypothetical protein
MRMAYSAVAHFLVQWTDCRLASALGLLKIMIFKVLFFKSNGNFSPSCGSVANSQVFVRPARLIDCSRLAAY